MAAVVDLERLATEAAEALNRLWTEMGVEAEERTEYLTQLSLDAAAIYESRVREQTERKQELVSSIEECKKTILGLQSAMEETEFVRASHGMTLLGYQAMLDDIQCQLQEDYNTRMAELKSREELTFALYADIGEAAEPAFASIGSKVSHKRTAQYDAEIARLEGIRAERAAQITTLCGGIEELWNEMSFGPAEGSEFEAAIPRQGAGLGWTPAVIAQLESITEELQKERDARENKIATIGKEITLLWSRLQTPEEEQNEFLESKAGLGDECIEAVEEYLKMKREEFSVRLVELIADARATIDVMWSEMRAGPEQRKTMFAPYYAGEDEFTDELYLSHEAYIKSLAATLELMKPILRSIEKRVQLLDAKSEYERIVADPTRLKRGNAADRLKEEKLERRVKKELPAVTKQLRADVVKWEAECGCKLVIEDAGYLQALDTEEAAELKAHEEAKAARDAAKKNATTASDGASSTSAAPSGRSTSAPGRTSIIHRSTSNSNIAALAPAATAAVPAAKKAAAPSRKGSATAATSTLAAAVAGL